MYTSGSIIYGIGTNKKIYTFSFSDILSTRNILASLYDIVLFNIIKLITNLK